MRLTAKKAVELSIELWTWLAETGKEKPSWKGWKYNGGQYLAQADCFLCEYAGRRACKQAIDNYCALCLYYKTYGYFCIDNVNCSTPFEKWCDVETKPTRKKYAKLFLEQLKGIE